MEAHSITGPAKNLLEFAKRSRVAKEGLPSVCLSIAAYQRSDEPEGPFIQAVRSAGVPFDIIRERGRFDPTVSARLREIIAERNPDIVQTHNIKSHFFMRLSGIARDRSWLAFHHGFTNENLRMQIYNSTGRWSYRGAKKVVTVCFPFVEQLVSCGVKREQILVRQNSVTPFVPPDDTSVQAARKEVSASGRSSLVVTVGRLSQEKGHADLIEAFALMRLARPELDAHLVIVGEGQERQALEQQITRLQLESCVSLVGQKQDVRPYYAFADLVVLPSHSEGSPNVLLEAMAAGRAIVATKVGGVPDMVQNEDTAIIVPPSNSVELAKAMERVLTNQELGRSMGVRARSVAEAHFSPDQYCQSMIQLYRQVLQESANVP